MKVLEFAFDTREQSDYLPYTYVRNTLFYADTYDNEVLAKKYKISRERVRQIEERAYNKLRDAILAETTGNSDDK